MSCPQGPAICIFRADTYQTTLTATEDGSPLNITNYTITFAAKHNINSSTTDISVTATIIDAVNGIARVSLTTTDTDIEAGALTYDVEYRDSTDSVVKTYQGTMTIKQDVA